MTVFKNIKELIKTLDWSKELLSEMFEKRNSFAYKYDMAIQVLGDVANYTIDSTHIEPLKIQLLYNLTECNAPKHQNCPALIQSVISVEPI